MIAYGSFELSNPDLATVTVTKFALFLVIETVGKVSPLPTNVTVAAVVSNKRGS